MTSAQYQLALLGPGARSHAPKLRRVFMRRLRELDRSLPGHLRVLTPKNRDAFDGKAPTVGVYFGGARHSRADQGFLQHLMSTSAVVIPVVGRLSEFGRSVPKELASINGLALRDHGFDAIANLALENLGLLRKDRRLFISYRRNDSSNVALQLRHLFEASGYDAFLDTHDVRPGDPFQEVLWQRMLDSDLVVMLDSPNFLGSRWTKDTPAPHSDLCQRLYLKATDFNGRALRPQAINSIAKVVEGLRARCLAARYNNLVREFCDEAVMAGATTAVQPQRYVLATLKNRKRVAAIPAVGVPDALRYYNASLRFPGRGRKAEIAMLLYDHRGLRANWSEFLRWLDRHLPVKAIRITEVAAEIRKL